MEKDENQSVMSTIDCPHCKKKMEVQIVQIVRSDKITCPSCKKEIDLALFNTEQEKNEKKNLKELDKLRKLLPPE